MPTATRNRLPIPDFYETFVEGSVVRLLTGSQPMTVVDFCEDCGEVTVAYSDSDGDIDIIDLPAAALRHDETWAE